VNLVNVYHGGNLCKNQVTVACCKLHDAAGPVRSQIRYKRPRGPGSGPWIFHGMF